MKSARHKRYAPLGRGQRRLALYMALMNATAYELLRPVLRPDHFPPDDAHLSLLWEWAMVTSPADIGEPLLHALHARLQNEAAELDEVTAANAAETIEQFFQMFARRAQTPTICVLMIARQLMAEHLTRSAAESIERSGLASAIVALTEASRAIAAFGQDIGAPAFPPGWEADSALPLTSTGLDFLDSFLGGGTAPGEVYGLLGCYGGYKTTLGTNLAAEAARRFAIEAELRAEGIPRMAVLASYEMRIPVLRRRLVSYVARVPVQRLLAMKGLEDLSTTGALRRYERELFADAIAAGTEPAGEQERIREAVAWLDRHLILMDMTGYDPRGVGCGYLPELAQRIERYLGTSAGAACGAVVLDYVGAMAKRCTLHPNCSSDNVRNLIGSAPLMAKGLLAERFGCPVWLLHQYSGEANGRSPASLPDHTDAAECRSFGENLDFSFSLGRPTRENLVTFSCTKHRRQPATEDVVLRADGAMHRIELADSSLQPWASGRSLRDLLRSA